MITEGKTVGEILRAAREERKLSVEQVNRETKISVQTISALEEDDFDAFPSETYLKGFVRTYAEFLGLDGNRLWAMIGARVGAPAAGPGSVVGDRERRCAKRSWDRRAWSDDSASVLIVVVIVLVILLVRERRETASPAVAIARLPRARRGRRGDRVAGGFELVSHYRRHRRPAAGHPRADRRARAKASATRCCSASPARARPSPSPT